MRTSCSIAGFSWVLAVAAALLIGAAGVVSQTADAQTYLKRITVDIKEVSLAEALETVAELAGQDLEIVGNANLERRVSLSLQNGLLQKGLEQILQSEDYVIVWMRHNRVRVLLLNSNGEQTPELAEIDTLVEKLSSDPPAALLDASEEALPLPGEPAFGSTDPNDVNRDYLAVDPSQLEVVPPGSGEEMGFTLADIELLSALQTKLEPGEIELLPPDSDGFPRLTLGEFQEQTSYQPSFSRSEMEVIPPDLPGEAGITLEQLEAMRQTTDLRPPAEDLLPPVELP